MTPFDIKTYAAPNEAAQYLNADYKPSSPFACNDLPVCQTGEPARVIPPGSVLSNEILDNLDLSADQMRLERNLLYRDANPHAYFNDQQLEQTIDRITGTIGDSSNPANRAANIELNGQALANSQKLAHYEAAARIDEWRQQNPDKIIDVDIPAQLSENCIAQASAAKIQDAINDFYASKGFPFTGKSAQEFYRQVQSYEPNPAFDENQMSEDDRAYLDLLVQRRRCLTNN